MIYAILDSQAKTLTIARAGHEYPLIISNDQQKPIESLESKGMALGMVDNNIFDAVIEEKTYPLQDGDMCLLFTDGITEALNEREEEFSHINLLKFVQQYRTCEPHDFLEKLSNSTHKFVGKQLPSDDVTLLAFKIK